MTDDESDAAEIQEAVSEFLAGADTVYGEYDKGYADADAALSMLERHIDDLREAASDE